jgi:hypothetical protein
MRVVRIEEGEGSRIESRQSRGRVEAESRQRQCKSANRPEACAKVEK